MAIRIGINGFGRIGRLLYRIAMRQGGIEVVGVNDLVPADNLAYLLNYDTVHGRFEHSTEAHAEGTGFTCNGHHTSCSAVRDPSELPWKDLGVDYVVESTRTLHQG